MKPRLTLRRWAKLFVRRPWVQSALAWLLSAYLALTLRTMRWRFENRAPADAAVEGPEGGVALFWHGRIALALACRGVLKGKPGKVLISSSPDGELIAKIARRLRLAAIRGAPTRNSRLDQRNIGAFREAIRFIDHGGVVVVTPDGPHGPAERMPEGPVMVARTRGSPVFLFGLAARPTLTMRSWDRTQIPLPFGRGCVVFEGPLQIARGADGAAIEATRADWERRLGAAQSRAEALLAS